MGKGMLNALACSSLASIAGQRVGCDWSGPERGMERALGRWNMSDHDQPEGDQGDLGDFGAPVDPKLATKRFAVTIVPDDRCARFDENDKNDLGARNQPPEQEHGHSQNASERRGKVPLVPLVPLRWDRSRAGIDRVRDLAEALMRQHGLVDWTFEFDRAKARLGCCRHGARKITIAEFYARNNPIEHVRDTILHEIAHALCDPQEGHGPAWRAKAAAVGALPERCAPAVGLQQATRRWKGTCRSCGTFWLRHRRDKLSCSECTDRSGRRHWLKWTRNRRMP